MIAGKTYYREEHNQEYDKYMKLSTYEACLTFNTTDWYRTVAQGSGVYIGRDGIALGSTFNVDYRGILTATGGHIAGWNINNESLWNFNQTSETGISVNSNGFICGGKSYVDQETGELVFYGLDDPAGRAYWEINEDGQASFNNINVVGGAINISGSNEALTIIDSNGLYMKNGAIELGWDDVLDRPTFAADSDGKVVCSNLEMKGSKCSFEISEINGATAFLTRIDKNGIFTALEKNSSAAGNIKLYGGTITINGVYDDFGNGGGRIKSANYRQNNRGIGIEGFCIYGDGTAHFSDLYIGGVHYKSSDNSITYGEGMNIKFTTPMNIGNWNIGINSFSNNGGSINCKSLTVNGKSLTNYIKDVVTEAYLKGKLDSVYAAKNHQHSIPAENVYNGQTWVGATTGGTTT